jgi:hypothetical protein
MKYVVGGARVAVYWHFLMDLVTCEWIFHCVWWLLAKLMMTVADMYLYISTCHLSLIFRPSNVKKVLGREVTGYRLDTWGSILDRGKRFFSCLFFTASGPAVERTFPPIQWVPGAFSPGVKMTIDLHLVSWSRIEELYLHFTIRLHGVLLN